MKKICFVLFIFITFTSMVRADWKDYIDITLADIEKKIIDASQSEHAKDILTLFANKGKLKIKVTENPTQIDQESIKYRDIYAKYQKIDQLSKMFNHQITYINKDISYIFLIQDPLLEHFNKEVKINQYVELFILFGVYDDKTKKVYIFVNEFKAM